MKRYTQIDVIKKAGERRYSETVRYPLIPPSIGDTYIVARTGTDLIILHMNITKTHLYGGYLQEQIKLV